MSAGMSGNEKDRQPLLVFSQEVEGRLADEVDGTASTVNDTSLLIPQGSPQ